MSKFFINRPIVAMVISIMFIILGIIAMTGLPIAQFPEIVPPEIQLFTRYNGADAETLEQSVATPIEEQVSGVDNMNYMYSVNASNGTMRMFVNFDVKTDPNTDLIFTQMRQNQIQGQLPAEVRNYGVTIQKSRAAPLMLVALHSPKKTYDGRFLANYAFINLNDQLVRVPGVAQVGVYGADRYAIRIWVRPDTLGKLGITVPDIVNAVQKQNTVNPAGQIGSEPVPPGQEFTYTVRTQGRLITAEDFGSIVVRANADGSIVHLKDVARIELGSQTYNLLGRLDGQPAGIMAIYQLPGSNALSIVQEVNKLMERAKQRFPADLDYTVALDTTRSIGEGIREILKTLFIAMGLVILVVFIFLQGWRATLIPTLAVPVSLIGTFAVFPLLGFSINTLSLFGLVLAIGLVVDDAIIVVEAVERHMEEGFSPKESALKAMSEVAGPVMAIALILAAVFIPVVFIPGITGRLYQQFAVTIAISVLISAFNALTLSPALCALILKPGKEGRGFLGPFFKWFNNLFGRASKTYLNLCGTLIRKSGLSLLFLVATAVFGLLLANGIPRGFLPEEDQGYLYINVALPDAASIQRSDQVCRKIEEIIRNTPGVEHYQTLVGNSLMSLAQNTYSGFFFVTLKEWKYRNKPGEEYGAIMAHLNRELGKLPQTVAFAFQPPAIPGIGLAGGANLVLEDRAGKDISFLAENVNKFIDAARKRPELARVTTTFLPAVPQLFVNVDREKVLKQGVDLAQVYQTLQTFMGGYFINYFNRFSRQWQVYVQAEGEYRTKAENVGQFYVLNDRGDPVPLSALTTIESRLGPEFTMRYNLYRSAQINAVGKPGFSTAQVMSVLEDVFRQTMPADMGFDYIGMSFQEKKAQEGIPASAIFGFSLLCVFLILAAQYESWSLPFSVLLGTPVAVFGAFAGIWLRHQANSLVNNNIYAQIGLIVLIGLSAKNAILIVEFAKTRHERGRPLADAALEGARLRLRPILMTSFAFLLGVLPLAFSHGAGAVARQIMGTAVMGGTAAASLIAIFLIPVTFYVVGKVVDSRKRKKRAEGMERGTGGTGSTGGTWKEEE
jgi:hydrophobic/amphiphilic exporter-1 (mainly G- bacteria), HAE1 family